MFILDALVLVKIGQVVGQLTTLHANVQQFHAGL
jgi:hypothetical protein